MVEEIPLRYILSAVVYVVFNVVSLIWSVKWIRADIKNMKESEIEVAKNFNAKVKRLYDRTDNMMSKQEIAELVSGCVNPIKEDTQEMKASIHTMSESITQMSVSFARMDERMKTRQADNLVSNRRVND